MTKPRQASEKGTRTVGTSGSAACGSTLGVDRNTAANVRDKKARMERWDVAEKRLEQATRATVVDG